MRGDSARFYHQLIATCAGCLQSGHSRLNGKLLNTPHILHSAYTMTNACLMKTQSVSSSRLRNHKPSQRVGLVSVLLGLDLEVVRVLVQRVLAGGDDGPEVWGLELDGGSAIFTW